MIKKASNWLVDKRVWFFLVSCTLALLTLLFLHGSVYRYIRNVNGIWETPKDTRTHGVFLIYKVISISSLGVLLIASALYLCALVRDKNKDNIVFIAFISFFILLITISLIVLGVKYV